MSDLNGIDDTPDLPPSVEVTDEEIVTDAEVITSEFKCENCGRELEYSGRGRKPKHCKRGEGCNADSAPIRGVGRNEIERIRNGMRDLYVMIGTGAGMLNQMDGFIIVQNADKLADSWAALAAQDAKARKALSKFLTGTSWSSVIAAHAVVAVPILQNHGVIPHFAEMMAPKKDSGTVS